MNILFRLKNYEIIFPRKKVYTYLCVYILFKNKYEIINLEIIDVLILEFWVTSKYILSRNTWKIH